MPSAKRPPGGLDRPARIDQAKDLVSRASGSPDLVGSVGRISSLKYSLILSDKSFRPIFKISLLGEYRTRLIADVVTGKLDVREAAARLPAEPEESDEPDILEELEEPNGAGEDQDGAVGEEA